MFMEDTRLFAKNKKDLETLIQVIKIYSQDIGMEFGIDKCAMFIMKIGEREIREERELLKSRKKQNDMRKGKLLVFWMIGNRNHQTNRDER